MPGIIKIQMYLYIYILIFSVIEAYIPLNNSTTSMLDSIKVYHRNTGYILDLHFINGYLTP